MNLGNRLWVALECCHSHGSSLKRGSIVVFCFPSSSFLSTIMYSLLVFLKNDIEGEKVLCHNLKCYPFLPYTPAPLPSSQGAAVRLGGEGEEEAHKILRLTRSGLDYLRDFTAPRPYKRQ